MLLYTWGLHYEGYFKVVLCHKGYTFFYRQLDFSSEPGVANEILENEPKSCLTVL